MREVNKNGNIEASAELNELQSAYRKEKLRAAQRMIHIVCGIASTGNFLFLVADLALVQDQTVRLVIALVRYMFSIVLILMIRTLQNTKSESIFSTLVTLLETASYAIFLLVFWLYSTPHFMIQTLGLILFVLLLFIIPNRNWNRLALSIAGSVAFFLVAYFKIPSIPLNDLVAAITYAALTIGICAVTAFSIERHMFREFVVKSRLEQTSSTDYLTNVATRIRLEMEAERWIAFCRRQGLPLCVAFVDIDNLKKINDTFGHAAGDEVLKHIAQFIQSQLRGSDTIARWGGDEFVLLLPNVSLENAVALLERIQKTSMQIRFDHAGPVSFSSGVVEMGPDSTYLDMVAEADAQMYRSKNDGKAGVSCPETRTADNEASV